MSDATTPKSGKILTLCGGSCRSCPDAIIDDGKLTLVEFGEKVQVNEEQLQMLVKFARDNGFEV